MLTSMADLVRLLVDQQNKIFHLCGFEDRPIVRPPVDTFMLRELDSWWMRFGGPIPPSYREFLLVCDGIEFFSLSYGLFGARDYLSASYPKLTEEVFAAGTGIDRSSEGGLVLIGHDPETTTHVFIDMLHEPLAPGEAVVLDGAPGDMSIYGSFVAFLELKARSNELTFEQLKALHKGATDE